MEKVLNVSHLRTPMDGDGGIGRRSVLAGLATAGVGLAAVPRNASAWGWDLHRETTRIACEQMGVGPVNRTMATAVTTKPDDWGCDCDPQAVAADVVPAWAPSGVESEVVRLLDQLPHSYGQYYNPGFEVSVWGYDVDVGGFGNAPDNVRQYANRAREATGTERWRQFGYAAHFLTDVGQPLHTGEEFDQATNEWVHHSFERGTAALWPELEPAFRGDGDAHDVEDPEAAAKDLARIAHEHSERAFSLVYDDPAWRSDPETRREVLELSRACLGPTGRYLRGLVEWVREDAGESDGSGDDGDDSGGGGGGWWWLFG
jgi:hypothetical protein